MAKMKAARSKKLPKSPMGNKMPMGMPGQAPALTAGAVSPALPVKVKGKAAKKLAVGGTHSHAGMEFDNSMRGMHHDQIKHDSGDR